MMTPACPRHLNVITDFVVFCAHIIIIVIIIRTIIVIMMHVCRPMEQLNKLNQSIVGVGICR